MLDYDRIIEDVRSALYTATPDHPDFLSATAADYSVACEEVNDRLRQCNALLKKGLVGEALRQCETEPNLLEAVATLDFLEAEQWRQMLADYNIVQPMPLLLDIAGDLNEAYATSHAMDALMQRHRLYAIGHAPLRLRLGVLRQLATADPDNAAWQEDVELFEQERHKQIQSEAVAATKAGDVETIQALDDELQQPGWLLPPPEHVMSIIRKSRQQMEESQTRARLEELSEQLHQAYGAFEVERARRLREQWEEMVDECQLDPDDPLHAHTAPALDWLDEQDRQESERDEHEGALAHLERALDRRFDAVVLERAYHAAVRHGHELPPRLEERYRSRMQAYQTAATRKMALIITSVVAAALLVAGLTAWWIFQSRKTRLHEQHLYAIQQLIQDTKWNEAANYLQKLTRDHPELAARPEFQKQDSQIQGQIEADKTRHEAFLAIMEAARASGADASNAEALEEAGKMAKTADERAMVAKFRAEIAAANRTGQAKRDAEFQEQMQALADRLKDLEAQRNQHAGKLQQEIVILESDLEALEKGSGGVSYRLLQQTNPLRVRLAAVQKALKNRLRETEFNQSLDWAVKHPDRYQKVLQQFVEKFPNSKRTSDFQQVLQEVDLWKEMVTWDTLLEQAAQMRTAPPNPETAAKFLAEVQQVLKDYGDFPAAGEMRDRLPWWEAIAQRESGEPLARQIRALFEVPEIKDLLWILDIEVAKKGQPPEKYRYYFTQQLKNKLKISDGWFFYSYVKDFRLGEGRRKFDPQQGERLLSPTPLKAPQVAMYEKVKRRLNSVRGTDWEASVYRIVKEIITADDVDALLRLRLATDVLELGCQGSVALQKGFATYLQDLKAGPGGPFVNWIDPHDQNARASRERASRLLKIMGEERLLAAGKRVKQEQHNMVKQPLPPRYQCVGWLNQDKHGKWQCRPETVAKQPRALYCIFRDGVQKNNVKIVKLGQLEGNQLQLESSGDAGPVIGRPLYALR